MLEGATVLISGSSKGIGAATAQLAARYGATVILHGRTASPRLRALAKALKCKYVACDAADEGKVSEAVRDLLKETAAIDSLVNCVGITNPNSRFEDQSSKEWLNTFRVNVLGTVHFCRAVLPLLKRNGYGRIVNVASIRGYSATAGRAAYSATKAAIVNLTSVLAREYAPSVTVNAVAPGFVATEMARAWSERAKRQAAGTLIGRPATPEEIGEVICFLLSDRARYMTGQTVIVDGGAGCMR